MKTKLKLILILGCVSVLSLGLAACANTNEIENNQKQGLKISVTYDANGGSLMGRQGVSIVDMFRPEDYQKDSNGEIHIKLLEPTDILRADNPSDPITLEMPDHFYVGWYQTREMQTVNGKPVDEEGNELLQLEDGSYIIASTANAESPTEATPVYNYSDPWNFAEDTVDYSEEMYAETDGICEITLYAAWVEYYEFNYYYQKDGKWTQYGSTSFDYKAEQQNNQGADTVVAPEWDNGKMNYQPEGAYSAFPKLNGTTFKAAYSDEACQNEIKTLTHSGSVDYSTARAINPVQNIYVVLDEGEQYKIETVDQLISYASSSGYYEIFNDLEFTAEKTWPTIFSTSEFTGRMYGSEGKTVTFKNVKVTYSMTQAQYGGVFGALSKDARLENVTFENVTFDLAYAGQRQVGTSFGLFAGLINKGATLTNVSVIGELIFKIGPISLGSDYNFNLLANGEASNINADKTQIKLQLYGQEMLEGYKYTIDYEAIAVNYTTGNISLELKSVTSNESFIEIK